jgi:hypothetical protein
VLIRLLADDAAHVEAWNALSRYGAGVLDVSRGRVSGTRRRMKPCAAAEEALQRFESGAVA